MSLLVGCFDARFLSLSIPCFLEYSLNDVLASVTPTSVYVLKSCNCFLDYKN